MDKKGLLIVMAQVKTEDEEAFNKWYNEDHLPKAIERFPGVLSGRPIPRILFFPHNDKTHQPVERSDNWSGGVNGYNFKIK